MAVTVSSLQSILPTGQFRKILKRGNLFMEEALIPVFTKR
jgi:hypothetical protein